MLKRLVKRNSRKMRQNNVEKKLISVTRRPPTNINAPSTSATTQKATPFTSQATARTPTLSSAKKRKVEIQLQKRKDAVDDEMLLVSRSYLEKKFGTLKCPQCFGKIKIDLKNKYLDYQIDLVCEECSYTDIYKDEVEETPISKTVVYIPLYQQELEILDCIVF